MKNRLIPLLLFLGWAAAQPLCFVIFAQIPDKTGPVVRLVQVEISTTVFSLEGSVFDSRSPIKQISYNVADDFSPFEYTLDLAYDPLKAKDGKYDSLTEEFSIRIPSPSGCNITVKAVDEKGNASYLRVYLIVRTDYQNYLVYLSPSALNAGKTEFDNFRVYYTAGVPEDAVDKVRKKLSGLRKLADRHFALKDYDTVSLMLYAPEPPDAKTLQNYRGVLEEKTFTFPFKISSARELDRYNPTLDGWIPHELGDHTVRGYFSSDKFAIRWLSEGIGEYLKYLYIKKHFGRNDAMSSRIKLYEQDDRQAEAFDLLDGEWGPGYYLCSAAFVTDLAQRHGTKAFKKLFRRLNKYPKDELSEELARKILSEITGEDITARITGFRTADAIKILDGLE